MKLSKNQIKVMKLLQEGWELGSMVSQVGFVGLVERAWLQKHGIGHGAPIENTKIVTVNALVRKGLIKRFLNRFIMTQSTRYQLTKKGKELELEGLGEMVNNPPKELSDEEEREMDELSEDTIRKHKHGRRYSGKYKGRGKFEPRDY